MSTEKISNQHYKDYCVFVKYVIKTYEGNTYSVKDSEKGSRLEYLYFIGIKKLFTIPEFYIIGPDLH